MSMIPVKKLKDDNSGNVSSSDGSAFYPLSVPQSVVTNAVLTINNKFCGSYHVGDTIPIKTDLATILTNLLSTASYTFLCGDDIDTNELSDSDSRIPSSRLVAENVETLDNKIESRIIQYSAGTGSVTGLVLSNENVFGHYNDVSSTSGENNKLRLIRFDNHGHIISSTSVDFSSITSLPANAQLSDVISAYNDLISVLNPTA